MVTVIFACRRSEGRAEMATALFRGLADPVRARAIAVTEEPVAPIAPLVRDVMNAAGLDVDGVQLEILTPDLLVSAHWLVTLDADSRTHSAPGLHRQHWDVPGPFGQDAESVCAIRDELRARIHRWISDAGWSVGTWV